MMDNDRTGRDRGDPTPGDDRPAHVTREGGSARATPMASKGDTRSNPATSAGGTRCPEGFESLSGPHLSQADSKSEDDQGRPSGKLTLLRELEHAREQRGSPSLWDAIAARFDSEERQRNAVAPMVRVLDQVRERVDDETWGLILDFEWRASQEVISGIEIGIELGYENGRAAALVEAQGTPGTDAAKMLQGRLADVIGDAEAEYAEVQFALLATLQATVMMTARATPFSSERSGFGSIGS